MAKADIIYLLLNLIIGAFIVYTFYNFNNRRTVNTYTCDMVTACQFHKGTVQIYKDRTVCLTN